MKKEITNVKNPDSSFSIKNIINGDVNLNDIKPPTTEPISRNEAAEAYWDRVFNTDDKKPIQVSIPKRNTRTKKRKKITISKSNYSELLKDPRWQRKRLEILQRDEFKCRSCTDDLNTLHVHHLFYDKDLDPWDYKDDDLITLCETCHEALHYLTYNKSIGMETFVPVCKLMDELEQKSIEEFLETYHKNG